MIDTLELKTYIKPKYKNFIYTAINNLIRNIDSFIDCYNNTRKPKLLHDAAKDNNIGFYKHTAAFAATGIIDIAIKGINTNCCRRYALILRYKPAIVLHEGDRFALSEEEDYEQAIDNLKRFLNELDCYILDEIDEKENLRSKWHFLPKLNDWIVNQVHYAIEEETPNYPIYCELLQRATGHHEYASSIYINNTSTRKNFYDKTIEQEAHCNLDISSFSEHIMRYEVQCNKKFIDHQVSNGNIPKASIENLWSRKIAYRILSIKLKEIFGNGIIYSLEEATKIIEKSFKPSKAAKLISFLSCTQLCSKTEAIEITANKFDITVSKVRRNILGTLTSINIASIVLPNGATLQSIENPLHLLQ